MGGAVPEEGSGAAPPRCKRATSSGSGGQPPAKTFGLNATAPDVCVGPFAAPASGLGTITVQANATERVTPPIQAKSSSLSAGTAPPRCGVQNRSVHARAAIIVLLVLAVMPAPSASAARHLLLGGGDGFFVTDTQIVCGISKGGKREKRTLLCALGNRRLRRVVPRSRLALLSDSQVLVERAPTEPRLLGPRVLFAQVQPQAAGPPFHTAAAHRRSFALGRGDTVSVAGTHIWCIDLRATLTCITVRAAARSPRAGALGISVARATIGLLEATRRRVIVIAAWPIIGPR